LLIAPLPPAAQTTVCMTSGSPASAS
jgi:hypothetical protein